MFSSRKSAAPSTGYLLTKSLRFRSSASAYLNRTPASAGNRKTMTFSFWVKRGFMSSTQQNIISAGTGSDNYIAWSSTNDYIEMNFRNGGSASNVFLITTQVFRDPSAWYHIVLAIDTTQATASNRVKLYVNGSQVTAFGTTTYPTQNNDLNAFNNNVIHHIGQSGVSGFNFYLDGYLTEINFIDGQQLNPSSFGSTNAATGVWQPIRYTGTYGTNGFYLPFTDTTSTTTLGNDSSGNGNNWTTNNISLTAGTTYDSMTDVPTNTDTNTANYCVLNPLDKYASLSISNGNLTLNGGGSAGNWWSTRSTIWVSSGKWYWESTIGGSQYNVVGVAGVNQPISTNDRWVGYTSDSYGYYGANGNKINNNTSSAYGASYTAGDVIGVALDMDAGTIVFYKNNSSQGTAFTGISGSVTPAFSVNDQGTDPYQDANFGQRPFAYTPPSGYVALNTFNLPTPTIGATASTQANDYFDVSLWTGNGTSQSITNSGSMQPDFVWYKGRSTTYNHGLFDSIRGTLERLSSNLTSAESTTAGSLTAFNSNGFSVGNDAGANQNTDTYVGWQWKANGSGSSNTAGSITSTVSANTTAGFSIVTYTGNGSNSTIGHGLGVVPAMYIVKIRNGANNWIVWHQKLANTTTSYILLDSTAAETTSANVWGSTAATSSTIGVGTAAVTNANTSTYVAYCFAQVAGYSAFGSYTGNGSADGPFVYCGFQPKWLMIKVTNTTDNWYVIDTVRQTYNVFGPELAPNLTSGDTTFTIADIVSNGFKIRNSGSVMNGNGNTVIYAAFASNPFKNSLAF